MAPPRECWPAEHGWQSLLADVEDAGQEKPCAHLQSSHKAAPVAAYLPGEHAAQDVAALALEVPAGHAPHSEAADAAANLPAGQYLHASAEAAPGTFAYLPDVHCVHCVEPAPAA